jgi:hypothetical protein
MNTPSCADAVDTAHGPAADAADSNAIVASLSFIVVLPKELRSLKRLIDPANPSRTDGTLPCPFW